MTVIACSLFKIICVVEIRALHSLTFTSASSAHTKDYEKSNLYLKPFSVICVLCTARNVCVPEHIVQIEAWNLLEKFSATHSNIFRCLLRLLMTPFGSARTTSDSTV
jgi:hypothetical protein